MNYSIDNSSGNSLRNLLLVLAVLALGSCTKSRLNKAGVFTEFPPKAYQTELASVPNPQIIDVRTPGEYDKGLLESAQNISWLAGKFSERADAVKFDKELPIFIYCETQHRSPYAAKQLKKLGFTSIIDLKGGLSKWRKAGLDVEVSSDVDK
jgi:rhodanese-related sulfurtransferase